MSCHFLFEGSEDHVWKSKANAVQKLKKLIKSTKKKKCLTFC